MFKVNVVKHFLFPFPSAAETRTDSGNTARKRWKTILTANHAERPTGKKKKGFRGHANITVVFIDPDNTEIKFGKNSTFVRCSCLPRICDCVLQFNVVTAVVLSDSRRRRKCHFLRARPTVPNVHMFPESYINIIVTSMIIASVKRSFRGGNRFGNITPHKVDRRIAGLKFRRSGRAIMHTRYVLKHTFACRVLKVRPTAEGICRIAGFRLGVSTNITIYDKFSSVNNI